MFREQYSIIGIFFYIYNRFKTTYSEMKNIPYSYSIFFDFIESYLPTGFEKINADDPIMIKLNQVMKENNQFLTVSDLGKIKFLFASERIRQMIGVEPDQLDPSHFVELTHPDDLSRFGLLRALTFTVEREVRETQKGSALASFSLRFRNPSGVYLNYVCQAYFFYSEFPRKTVYLLQVISNAEWFQPKKGCYHHYLGKDLSLFKFPDEDLVNIGPCYSSRELEIIRHIEAGLSSKQIADKLFLSVHTVNTHRRNILENSGKGHISELIYDLKNQGLI